MRTKKSSNKKFLYTNSFFQILLMVSLTATDAYLDESLPVKSNKPSRNPVREHEMPSAREYTIRDLAASMHQHGLLYPIIVRPIEDGFELVAGNRRFEACRLLHWKYIPAKVRELAEMLNLKHSFRSIPENNSGRLSSLNSLRIAYTRLKRHKSRSVFSKSIRFHVQTQGSIGVFVLCPRMAMQNRP